MLFGFGEKRYRAVQWSKFSALPFAILAVFIYASLFLSFTMNPPWNSDSSSSGLQLTAC
jgi:hypothetical protein